MLEGDEGAAKIVLDAHPAIARMHGLGAHAEQIINLNLRADSGSRSHDGPQHKIKFFSGLTNEEIFLDGPPSPQQDFKLIEGRVLEDKRTERKEDFAKLEAEANELRRQLQERNQAQQPPLPPISEPPRERTPLVPDTREPTIDPTSGPCVDSSGDKYFLGHSWLHGRHERPKNRKGEEIRPRNMLDVPPHERCGVKRPKK
jgi:hypothetical protein